MSPWSCHVCSCALTALGAAGKCSARVTKAHPERVLDALGGPDSITGRDLRSRGVASLQKPHPALPAACLASGLQSCLVSPCGRSHFLANTLYLAARLLLVLLWADPELVRVVGNGRLCSVAASGKGCGVRHCPGREPQISGAKDVTPHTHREPHACLRATATLAVPLRVLELSFQATLPSSFRLAFPMGALEGTGRQ